MMRHNLKRIVLLIIFCCAIVCSLSAAEDDTWDGRDKVLHLGVSFIGYTVLHNICRYSTNLSAPKCIVASGSTMLAAGVIKELIDDEFSWKDIGANALGTGIGITVNIKF